MAKANDGQTLREYGSRKKRVKRNRRIIIGLLFIILLVVGGFYLFSLYNRDYQNYEVVKTTEITGENAVGFLDYGNAVVKYSKDGAVAISKDGELLWNGSYQMSEPIADICEKYVVIADKGGKSIHIFNNKGKAGNFSTNYDIIKVEVAAQGVVAVLMENGDDNHIILYDVDGTILGEKYTTVSGAGYPMDISLSMNGEKLAVSYLSVNKGKLISTVAFFNFGEVGKNYTDRFVGGYKFEDRIIPRVVFLNNDTVCAYKDNGFILCAIPEIPKILHEETLEGNIKSIVHNDKYTGVVMEAEETKPQKLLLYDLSGKKLLDKSLDFDYDKIVLSENEIILHNHISCLILKLNGNDKFRYTFEGNIAAFYPINDLDRYFLVNEDSVSQIALVE